MRTLFLRLKSYGLLRWTYLVAIVLIVTLCFLITNSSDLQALSFEIPFALLFFFGLPLLIAGILDVVTNSKIPLKFVLLVFNCIIIIGSAGFLGYHFWDVDITISEPFDNKWTLVDLPINEKNLVEKTISLLNKKYGETNYNIIASATSKSAANNQDSIKRGYEVYMLYSIKRPGKIGQLSECTFRTDTTNNLIETEDKPVVIDDSFIDKLKGIKKTALHYHSVFHAVSDKDSLAEFKTK